MAAVPICKTCSAGSLVVVLAINFGLDSAVGVSMLLLLLLLLTGGQAACAYCSRAD
jgi:hypothetical protein